MGEPNSRAQLLDVVRQVRRRWRIKLALRGAVGFLLAGVVAIVAMAYTLEALKFTATAIVAFRIVTAVVLVAAGAWFFARPLSRKVTDEQVALYLEEHEPTLDSTILSAMEESEKPGDWSPVLIQRLIENAIVRVHEIQEGHRIERDPMRRYAWLAGGVVVGAVALFTFGPAYLRHALSAIFVISSSAEAAAPYRITVTPGNASVPKGADQTIHATLSGFDATGREGDHEPPLPYFGDDLGQHRRFGLDGQVFAVRLLDHQFPGGVPQHSMKAADGAAFDHGLGAKAGAAGAESGQRGHRVGEPGAS